MRRAQLTLAALPNGARGGKWGPGVVLEHSHPATQFCHGCPGDLPVRFVMQACGLRVFEWGVLLLTKVECICFFFFRSFFLVTLEKGYPNSKNHTFMKKLKLRTILYLCPEDYMVRRAASCSHFRFTHTHTPRGRQAWY